MTELYALDLFTLNPGVKVADVQEDAAAAANVRKVASPDHLSDGP